MIKDQLVFFREFAQEFESTGSICPTSRWAANALAEPIAGQTREPRRVLEVGPGTGSVTDKILECMIEGDHLSICEINPRLMKMLRKKLEKDPNFQKFRANIDFHECPVQEIQVDKPFDVIICALPFLNFELGTVEQIFDKFRNISHDSTLMTYYEYMGIRSLSSFISSRARRERMKQLSSFFEEIHLESGLKRTRVWFNFLPINVYTLKVAA